jgi:hypothetical protein
MRTIRRRVGAGAIAATLLGSLAAPAAASAAAPAAVSATAGWRIVSTDRRPGIDAELAVVALSRTNAWAGGNVAPSHSSIGVPFVEHWNGRHWRNWRLPAGPAGALEVLSASAWNNVWAFGENYHGAGGFALRFDGHQWRVMKHWYGQITVVGAAVESPRNVWAFSGLGSVVEHYNGHRWAGVRVGPGVNWFDSAAALPGGEIWALAHAGGGEEVVTGKPSGLGYSWTATPLIGYQSGSNGSDPLTSILPVSPANVWALGGGVRIDTGHPHWYPLVAHWNGTAWQRVRVSGRFILGAAAASDGHGGLWVTTGWDSTGIPPHLLRFAHGTFTKMNLPPRDGRYVGVFGLARIPGSTSVWGAGALTGLGSLGPNTGVILKYGP